MLNNSKDNTSNYNQTAKVIGLVIALVMVVLLSRLVYLQVIQQHKFFALSEKNKLAIVPLEPKRGLIYDRNGVLLATNKTVHSLEIVPQIAKDPTGLAKQLRELNLINDQELATYQQQRKYYKPFESVLIKDNLTDTELANIATQMVSLPGLKIKAKLVRQYPYLEVGAHLLGYTGTITKDLYDAANGYYLTHQHVGKAGIEHFYEKLLRGKLGYEQLEVDAKGKVVGKQATIAPTAGMDIYLSIDIELQHQVTKIMQNHRGAAIVLNSQTAEVIALVSMPSFNPNTLVPNGNNQDLQSILKQQHQPLFNRAINGLYPLASPVKPFLALYGLEKQLITQNYQVFDPGWYKLPGSKHIFRDITYNKGGNGWVNLHNSIVKSSDTYYYHLANMLGIDNIHHILTSFNFGKKTDIDLTGEATGLVPNRQWKLRQKQERWYHGDSLLVGIGQGFLQVTPMQMAVATMLLANKGNGYRPHILSKAITADGTIVEHTPVKLPAVKLSKANYWQWVHNAMRGVIHEAKGTGWRFGKDAAYTAAGKTGTAQVISLHHNANVDKHNIPEHLRDHSSFISFAPFSRPEVIVIVLVENNIGSAKLAREILDAYFHNKKAHDTTDTTSPKGFHLSGTTYSNRYSRSDY